MKLTLCSQEVNFLSTGSLCFVDKKQTFSSENCINGVYYTRILHIHAAVYAGFFYFHF